MKENRRSFWYVSGTGCLLPVLLCVNLFFGWLILPVLLWLFLELVLLFGLFASSFAIAARIRKLTREHKEVIDVEARHD